MYGFKDLKKTIERKDGMIPCPVIGCSTLVPKMERKKTPELHHHKKNLKKFFCDKHGIYISPTTFRYQNRLQNALWKNDFNKITENKNFDKRFIKQFEHDRSEDALSYNVFRFLEKQNLINDFLSDLIGESISKSDVMYWTFSREERETWSELSKARKEFETRPSSGSEPDLIISTNRKLFFIEAKLTDRPRIPNKIKFDKVEKKYTNGGNGWFSNVFKKGFSFKDIAWKIKNYQLVRFWLIGSWIANIKGKDFILYNLVRAEEKKYYENFLNEYVLENNNRKYSVISWEDIYRFIFKNSSDNKDKDIILDYFRNKTIGYSNSNREIGYLLKAFSV